MRRGFTLIEVAIVLTVVGILIYGGMLAVNPSVIAERERATRSTMTGVEKALEVYVIQHGCLPCPADGRVPATIADAGRAVAAGGGFYDSGCAPAGCAAISGAVPYRSLGLDENRASDGFGNRLTYAASGELAMPGAVERVGAAYPTPGLDFTPIAVTTSFGTEAGFAYILVSHGEDGAGARAATTGQLQADRHGSPGQTENADGDADFSDQVRVYRPGLQRFDDLLLYRTPAVLIQACGAGSCGNP